MNTAGQTQTDMLWLSRMVSEVICMTGSESGGRVGKEALISSLPWEAPPRCRPGVQAWYEPEDGVGEVGAGGQSVQAMGGGGGDGGGPGNAGGVVQS